MSFPSLRTDLFTKLVLLTSLTSILCSCNDKNLSGQLEFNCQETNTKFTLTNIEDVKGNFSIDLPKTWKREFFVSSNESRLYAADTTLELNKTYILDLGWYSGELSFDDAFMEKLKSRILEKENTEIHETKQFLLQGKKALSIHTTTTQETVKTNKLQVYLVNNKNSYYIFNLDVYGNDEVTERFCEGIRLFDQAKLF